MQNSVPTDPIYGSLLDPAPWQDQTGVGVFVTTRRGGVSQDAYASFNCSPYCGDDSMNVTRNQRILQDLKPEAPFPFILPRQTHGTVVRQIDEAFLSLPSQLQLDRLEGVDALVTELCACTLCVSTADCLPVFFFDPVCKAIGIAHAGWRGTVQHIALLTLRMLQTQYGVQEENVRVAFGPSISQEAFEVGDEVYHLFQQQGFPMNRISFRNKTTGKWHLSLQSAVASELENSGVKKDHILYSPHCTYCNPDIFFSARQLGIHSGRILSGIYLTPPVSG